MSKPEIVCLCGSTRFPDAFRKATRDLTLEGKIVLSVGFFGHDPSEAGALTEEVKKGLDELHFRKIDLADWCLFLNVDGYLGDSSRREIAYSIFAKKKKIEFLNPESGEIYMEKNAHDIGRMVASFMEGQVPSIGDSLTIKKL